MATDCITCNSHTLAKLLHNVLQNKNASQLWLCRFFYIILHLRCCNLTTAQNGRIFIETTLIIRIMNYAAHIAEQLGLGQRQVEKTIELLEQGATVPFIARYRKEATGSLNEVQIAAIRDMLDKLKDLDKRREAIRASIQEQGKLTPELEKQILAAATMTELEDLYLPYKPKRRTRATMAMEKGLEPLANEIQKQYSCNLEQMAEKYVNPDKGVNSVEEA